ncbi:AAA family ATPase [Providencia alcalifaciens]|uniref:AAA family ATPase n=1 Tax=Providencia alcalifaciens TaxID=126385 RepID=UPI00029BD69B|nr:hypothetical protein OO9_04815 [Providencia alcalifaciens Dmel2]
MFIKQIQIEGGFLQGLEAEFTPGLNTIIGSRGTGKSSLVELIRFCLGVKRHSKNGIIVNDNQAIQILEDGIVTVTLEDNGNTYELVSTANRVSDRPLLTSRWPLIFSQTDIESIGLDQQSRINLIDDFIDNKEYFVNNKNKLKDIIILTCENIEKLQQEVELVDENKKKELFLLNEISKLKSMQTGYDNLNSDFAFNNEKLSLLNKEISNYHVDEEKLKYFSEMISELNLLHNKSISILFDLDKKSKPKILEHAINVFSESLRNDLEKTANYIATFKNAVEETHVKINEAINKLTEDSFKTRNEIEKFEVGSSEINRKIMYLTTDLSLVQASLEGCDEKKILLEKEKENLLLMTEKLILIDEEIFKKREEVIEELNKNFDKTIKIKGLHSNNTLMYADAFENCFRNASSSLKYKDIVNDLASLISKKELLRIVYNQDIDTISLFLGTTKQRSLSILSAFTFNSIAKILTSDVEDTFDFFLLDNGVYKSFSHLSVGQRCTVILPIILQNENQVVILDQPEDHIDNAFIAETLIPAIKKCASTGQLIIITHNANIPVLGEADNIIHLESDGRRGYVKEAGNLDNKIISNTISRIMEGGQKAFNIRAGFYAQ